MSKEERNTYKIESDENLGEVQIADEVVAIIAGLAATEVEGVSSMAGNITNDIVSRLGMKNLSKGVRVELGEEDNVKVEISFLALFGHNICEVAKEVQENVRRQIESMTGLHVTEVNVHVGGVTFAPAEKPAEPEEKTEPVSEAEESAAEQPAAEQPQDTPSEPETATE